MVAVKLPNGINLANTSILPDIGARVNWGHRRSNRFVTPIQRLVLDRQDFQAIPFTLFEEMELDLRKFEQIDKAPPETVTVLIQGKYSFEKNEYEKVEEQRHFTGASLFRVEDSYFLFDIDRREVEHKIFNPFVAKLPKAALTIKEAYELLKPQEVKDAEVKGIEVLRQGEWFFIKTEAPETREPTKEDFFELLRVGARNFNGLQKGIAGPVELRAGRSRPNNCSVAVQKDGVTYCSGTVTHSGREHAPLELGSNWYKPVANTSIGNFTISGDID